MKKIKYEPVFKPEDLRERIENLSKALSEVLGALQCFDECGAADIADDEAIFVAEVIGFFDLLELVKEEEYGAAIDSINKACWDIEVANEQGSKDIEHPWFGQATGGGYETNTFFPSGFREFDHRDYGPTPREEEEEQKWEEERKKQQASAASKNASQTAEIDFDDF